MKPALCIHFRQPHLCCYQGSRELRAAFTGTGVSHCRCESGYCKGVSVSGWTRSEVGILPWIWLQGSMLWPRGKQRTKYSYFCGWLASQILSVSCYPPLFCTIYEQVTNILLSDLFYSFSCWCWAWMHPHQTMLAFGVLSIRIEGKHFLILTYKGVDKGRGFITLLDIVVWGENL